MSSRSRRDREVNHAVRRRGMSSATHPEFHAPVAECEGAFRMSVAEVIPLPAPPEWSAVEQLLDEQAGDLTRWLQLVSAAQRDWTALVSHLPAHALAGVQPRQLAEALEELLDKLRTELTRSLLIATGGE